MVGAFVALAAAPACAQEEGPAGSYLTPFPAGDIYKMLLVGDDLAEGLLGGVIEAFAGDARVDVVKKHQLINGLVRPEFDDKLAGLDAALGSEPASVAIVMLGAWDRAQVKIAGGKRAPVGTVEWRTEYGARADRLMKLLKKRGLAVYWVGLPNVRKPDFDEDAKMMNEIIRERVYLNGLKYIDAYTGFADEQGGYSAYGPDVTGKMRLLREGDGVYFTQAGNRKLAHFVEREVRRDLTQAKSERSVPLAGSEIEQAKIHPAIAGVAAPDAAKTAQPGTPAQPKQAAPAAGSAPNSPGAAPGAAPGANPGAWSSTTTVAPAPDAPAADQKADNGKISLKMLNASGREEVVTLDIIRPAIPASVVALVTRRESADKPSQMGYSLVDQVAGGPAVMSSVTPSSAQSANGRGLSPTQSPYYRVLMKGERLAPKKGRADDFTWPRPEGPVTTGSVSPAEPDESAAGPKAASGPAPAVRPAPPRR